MSKPRDILRARRDDVLRLAAEYGATNVRVFGSVARGEDSDASDIDLLVDMQAGRSLFDLAKLEMQLESMLGCRVDVLTSAGMRGAVRATALRDAVGV